MLLRTCCCIHVAQCVRVVSNGILAKAYVRGPGAGILGCQETCVYVCVNVAALEGEAPRF